jgi:LysM repeat protein
MKVEAMEPASGRGRSRGECRLSPVIRQFSFAAMKFSARLFVCLLAVLLCALVNGCVPPGAGESDDEKEPHFIEGKHALNMSDYSGAIAEFEKAVEANPRNAAAHFELGILYEKPDEPDPAAAIYHYQKFLKLRPDAATAKSVRDRIMNCRQDLAKAVLPLPSSPSVQHDLEQLILKNKELQTEVDQWRAWYKAQQTNHSPPQASSTPQAQPTQAVQHVEPIVQTVRTNPAPATPRGGPGAAAHPRTIYIAQSRDTFMSISRKFNVKLDALMAANPGVDARKLRAGQTVNIP